MQFLGKQEKWGGGCRRKQHWLKRKTEKNMQEQRSPATGIFLGEKGEGTGWKTGHPGLLKNTLSPSLWFLYWHHSVFPALLFPLLFYFKKVEVTIPQAHLEAVKRRLPVDITAPPTVMDTLVLTGTQPHSPASLHTSGPRAEQRFPGLAHHWFLSKYAGRFWYSQTGGVLLSLLSSPGGRVCFPRLHGTVCLVKRYLKRKIKGK